MATPEQEAETKKSLEANLAELSAIEPMSLVRADELGQALSFRDGLPYFERALRLFRDLSKASLDTVSHARLQACNSATNAAKEHFQKIRQFSLQQNPQNPAQARDNLVAAVRDHYDSWFDQVSPVISYSVRKGTDFEKLEQDARNAAAKVESIVTDIDKRRTDIIAEVEAVLEQVRRAAQQVGVSQHAIHFKSEAETQDRTASRWLKAVVGLAGTTTLLAAGNVVYWIASPASLSAPQSIQIAVAKLILFSVLFTAVIWTGRVYRALRHNAVVNKHRQNALTSFETFAKAATDEQTKSAVLLQATNCIFSPQATGYTDQTGEPQASPQVLEIIRGMTGTQG